MRKKELVLKIDELNAKIERLEECIKTQDRLIDGYQKRESAVIGALDTVESSVSRKIREAEEEAERIRTEAEAESKAFMKEFEMKAAEINDRISYYNALLERSAADAARNAEFFSVFAKKHVLPAVDSRLASGGITPLLDTKESCETSDDPQKLMHTIYRMEKRDVPDIDSAMPPGVSDDREIETVVSDDESAAPRVSELLGKKTEGTSQETSLEALLDEIIQTGDIF